MWSLLLVAGAAAAEEADALGLAPAIPVVDWYAPPRFAVVRANESVEVRFRVRGAGAREVLLQVDGRRGAVVCAGGAPCDVRATLRVDAGGWHAAAALLGARSGGGYTNLTAAAAPFFVDDPLEEPVPAEVPEPCAMRRTVVRAIAHDRARPLQNLLDSLVKAEYDGHTIDLEVHVDGAATPASMEGHAAAVEVARRFAWPHGRYEVVAREVNAGPTRHRFGAYAPGTCELVAYFEDDVVVDRLWHRWLLVSDQTSGADVAGFSFQRHWLCPGAYLREAKNGPHESRVVGPFAHAWRSEHLEQFLAWVNTSDEMKVPGHSFSNAWLGKKDWAHSLWTAYVDRWAWEAGRWFASPPTPDGSALATNDAGPGLHYNVTKGRDSAPFPGSWAPRLRAVVPLSRLDAAGEPPRRPPWAAALMDLHPWDVVGVRGPAARLLEACATALDVVVDDVGGAGAAIAAYAAPCRVAGSTNAPTRIVLGTPKSPALFRILRAAAADGYVLEASDTRDAEAAFVLRPRDGANPPSILARHHDADGGVEERVLLERYGVVQDLRTATT
jgi:hypothetical protein